MQPQNLLKEHVSNIRSIICFVARNKMCHLCENLSATTKIESLPYLDLGTPNTKFIKQSVQGTLGIGNGVYKL